MCSINEETTNTYNIGRFFAVQEIEMSLLYLLRNFDFDTVSGKRPFPVRTIAGVITRNCEDPLIFTPKKL